MTATRSLSASLQHLNRTLRADEAAALPDAELVGRFVEHRDEGAFTALVRRYGVLVFGVCRRVLRHEQDAEDAFQATFLVFARDAATVRRAGAVGNWLYGVAHNVARKARANRHRRAVKERSAAGRRPQEAPPVVPDDLRACLDGELGALPDKYRAPIVLCDLLGLTTEQAAAEVGCPPKTLGTRLTRARALLARRLTRRGVALSGAAPAAALGPEASAAVPARVLEAAAEAGPAFTTGSAAVGPTVAALTTGVSTVATHSSLKFAVLACGLLAAGAVTSGPVLRHIHAAHAPRTSRAATASPRAEPPAPPAIDLAGVHRFFRDLLPWQHTEPTAARADDKPKALAGVWVKKEGELKIEYAEKEVKLYPHGENKVIVVVCDYTCDKDGLVKAKITGFEGKEEAKKAIGEKVPVGTEFTFKWKAAKGAATLEEVKGEKIDLLKAHLEGAFDEKK